MFAPSLAQVKAEGLTTIDFIPQASEEPLFTSAPVIEIFPVPSNCTVIFLQVATGSILSSTVTVAVQVAEFPLTSVPVSVTVLVPIFAQVNEEISRLKDTAPQASVEPLSI